MEPNIVARMQGVELRLPELRFAAPVDWTIRAGEQWAVIGPNGAGKTLLAEMLRKKYALRAGSITYAGETEGASPFIQRIAFKDIYSLADCKESYYQQRWHATEGEEMPTVASLLADYRGTEALHHLLSLFQIESLLPKRLIYLSSGELRKFLIVRALLARPRILVLDNPFIGLDAASRELLVEMLGQLVALHDVQVVLLLSNPADIPAMVTDVLPLYRHTLLPPMTREAFLADRALIARLFPSEGGAMAAPVLLPVDPARQPATHRVTLRMEQVTIAYGTRTILKALDWEVKNGEKWSLSGPNGAGKSTLLSLVYADNPQSYANTFYLFDRKRGSGESIWEIKRRIGYVSPEMHLYYRTNVAAAAVVGSGFFDSVGLFRKCNAEEAHLARAWMRLFGIEALSERPFLTLSSGEQRLVLLARAFVKDPDLLILDEPLHGLDIHNKRLVTRVIESFCARPGKTLIYVTHYPAEVPPCVTKHFRLEKH